MKEFKAGDKVTFDKGYGSGHGIVKSKAGENHYFVVYHWDDKPDEYANYTAERTFIEYLYEGWI